MKYTLAFLIVALTAILVASMNHQNNEWAITNENLEEWGINPILPAEELDNWGIPGSSNAEQKPTAKKRTAKKRAGPSNSAEEITAEGLTQLIAEQRNNQLALAPGPAQLFAERESNENELKTLLTQLSAAAHRVNWQRNQRDTANKRALEELHQLALNAAQRANMACKLEEFASMAGSVEKFGELHHAAVEVTGATARLALHDFELDAIKNALRIFAGPRGKYFLEILAHPEITICRIGDYEHIIAEKIWDAPYEKLSRALTSI